MADDTDTFLFFQCFFLFAAPMLFPAVPADRKAEDRSFFDLTGEHPVNRVCFRQYRRCFFNPQHIYIHSVYR